MVCLSVCLSVRLCVPWAFGSWDCPIGLKFCRHVLLGSLVVSAKFLGQGVVGFRFGGLWSGKKSSIMRKRGHSFCSKSTWKDSRLGQG